MPYHLPVPTTILFAGPTSSGKTFKCLELLQNSQQMFISDPPKTIVVRYSTWQDKYKLFQKENPEVIFEQGMITKEELRKLGIYMTSRLFFCSYDLYIYFF